ncbi:MAG: hypothetical protein WAW02_06785 [Sideroxyarcus sp.]
MNFFYLILALALSGCVNLEFPGLIADTAKVGKDAYGAIVGKKEAQEPAKQEPAKPVVEQTEYITHAYIGQESQSITEIKQLCVSEAAEKLFKIAGREVRYTVIENTIATVNNTVVANCRLDIDKSSVETPVARQ